MEAAYSRLPGIAIIAQALERFQRYVAAAYGATRRTGAKTVDGRSSPATVKSTFEGENAGCEDFEDDENTLRQKALTLDCL
jgi:hypothetical protein